MNLDLAQVEAFVAAADQLHFGRAATGLFLTQQALSKRIARLEQTVGEPLFVRRNTAVELTVAGRGFLPHARRLLDVARETEQAVAGLRVRPLRVDVWGQAQSPLRILRETLVASPSGPAAVRFEVSMRRSLPAALDALVQGDIDAAFGRPYDLDRDWPEGLSRRPFYLEAAAAAMTAAHPYADRSSLTPDDLRATGLWWPLDGSPPELLGWIRRYADEHAIPLDVEGPNLGLDHSLSALRGHRTRIALLGADWPIPPESGIKLVPVWPIPHYPWWLIWRTDDRHPLLDRLLELLDRQWTGQLPGWIPEIDRADL
ncbi:LysR family transcriptional regulator [Streptosporangium sp. NPDC000396]|uniref:LysR family transcriptional regulator n=1 Tax=Streptosporangium sp. NPDC000396 TaxID=3366185 RepID=UPI00368A409C